MKIKPHLLSEVMLHGEDILRSPGMQLEKEYTHHRHVTCYEHSVLVAITALHLAEALRIKVERRSLIRGALLHDYFLYDSKDPDSGHRFHWFSHARCALKNAARDFSLNKIEKDIIATHMFPVTPAPYHCRESLLVSLADKISATREGLHLPIAHMPAVRAMA